MLGRLWFPLVGVAWCLLVRIPLDHYGSHLEILVRCQCFYHEVFVVTAVKIDLVAGVVPPSTASNLGAVGVGALVVITIIGREGHSVFVGKVASVSRARFNVQSVLVILVSDINLLVFTVVPLSALRLDLVSQSVLAVSRQLVQGFETDKEIALAVSEALLVFSPRSVEGQGIAVSVQDDDPVMETRNPETDYSRDIQLVVCSWRTVD